MRERQNLGGDMKLKFKLVERKLKRLPTTGKIALGISLLLSLLLYITIFLYFLGISLKDKNVLEVKKCPACYGRSLCKDFENGNCQLEGWSQLRIFHLLNVKNVHFATYKSKRVVLKKLGHNTELEELDKSVCKMAGKASGCKLADVNIFSHNTGIGMLAQSVQGVSDMMQCASQRLVDRSVVLYSEKAQTLEISAQEKLHFLSTLLVNQEPILLQTFPKSEGWPFPEYIGACGRWVMMEYVGSTLGTYYDAPWQERLDYTYQILQIAEQFTQSKLGYTLYWTDLDYDNLAVNSQGKVFIIDAENIIVVDSAKIKRDAKPGWDIPHYSTFDECKLYGTCLSFSVEALCTYYTTDHNYYAACRNLLSSYASDHGRPGGLLHDVPPEVEAKWGVKTLLEECAKPSTPDGRLTIKEKLLTTLQQMKLEYF